MSNEKVNKLATAIRVLSAEGVEKANSGHPGMPLGTADLAAVLWSEFLKFNPEDSKWGGRDRFVLSAGHGSMLIYSLLHLFDFGLKIDDLKNFRQWGSLTPGHPEFGLTNGVEVTTGPLGQGFANGIGLALSAKMLAAKHKTELVNTRVFGIVSDGDLMEGISSEAASLAGHLKLDNVVYIYDDNDISIGGSTDICFTEDIPKRFESCGWNVQTVDGHNVDEIRESLEKAIAHKGQPSIICARTKIGLGSPNKVDTSGVHGSPLGSEELALTKKALGWSEESFFVPEDVTSFCSEVIENNKKEYNEWNEAFSQWSNSNPEEAKEYKNQQDKVVPSELEDELFSELGKIEKDATRNISGAALQILAKHLPGLVGGSADLEPSTKTLIKDSADITPEDFSGRNLRYGVREHAMGAICNGMAYTGEWIPYTATFLVFADYMRHAIRLAALSHIQSMFIFTHDSFFVGEDGPTHQPIEHTASLRIIPNLDVYRPADGIEVAACYMMSVKRTNKPSAHLFTRQGLPLLERESFNREDAYKGGYIVSGKDNSEVVLVATGSEVALAADTAKLLSDKKVRVVSIPCVEIFMEQSQEYRDSVIPQDSNIVLLEAGISTGWSSVVGNNALFITKDSFGASAPAGVLAEKFGFSANSVADKINNKFYC